MRHAVALLAWAVAPMLAAAVPAAVAPPIRQQPALAESVPAEYRGCDAAGWCRFWIRALDPLARSPHRVFPEGVARTDDDSLARAVRDRLNALLASMVHQHKRIVLHDLRPRGDGTFAARVTVNEADVALDPRLVELREMATR